MSKQRYFKIGRDNFYTDLYIGAYYQGVPGALPASRVTSMSYGYLRNPAIDYEEVPDNPQQFYDSISLSNRNYTVNPAPTQENFEHYSPYFQPTWTNDPDTDENVYKVDRQISLPIPSADVPFKDVGLAVLDEAQYSNFAKVQIFIRWGYEYVTETVVSAPDPSQGNVTAAAQIDSRGKSKMIQLVTFKGRFD